MKLLYITNSINGTGGLERVLSTKINALIDVYGYDVDIMSLNNGNANPFYPFSTKVNFVSISYSGGFLKSLIQYKQGLKQVVALSKPDIIMVCDDGLKGFFVPYWIQNIPVIYERHASIELNADNSFKGKIQRLLMRKLARKFVKFVVLTPSNMQEWNLPNMMTISNPLPFQGEKPMLPKAMNKIVVVGSHSYNKGYDRLCEIWKNIFPVAKGWVLEVYGKIDAEETYIRMAEAMQLERILFCPPVKDIEKVYKEASILLLPSRSEGFGMILIEAMAYGVSCISFDCPSGPRDIIEDGVNGFLIENGNVESFVRSTVMLMNDVNLRNEIGNKAFETVKCYQLEAIIQQWDHLFRGLIGYER